MSLAKKAFTEKEIRQLKANPYTYQVTPNKIQFTAEFKEGFWKRYQSGEPALRIVKELGYNPDVLGKIRISGIRQHIKNEITRFGEFHTGYPSARKASDPEQLKNAPPEQVISRLQNEIIYLRQELDFIKKIISSDNHSRRKE